MEQHAETCTKTAIILRQIAFHVKTNLLRYVTFAAGEPQFFRAWISSGPETECQIRR